MEKNFFEKENEITTGSKFDKIRKGLAEIDKEDDFAKYKYLDDNLYGENSPLTEEERKNIYKGQGKDLAEEYHNYNSYDNSRNFNVYKVIGEKIKKMHDEYHPEAIFVTQTSSTLYGWSIKEFWKKLWPTEKVPKILTLNLRPLNIEGSFHRSMFSSYKHYLLTREMGLKDYFSIYNPTTREEDNVEPNKKLKKRLEDYVSSALSSETPNIPVAEKLEIMESNSPEAVKLTEEVISKLKQYEIRGNVCVVDEGPGLEKTDELFKTTGWTLCASHAILDKARISGGFNYRIGLFGMDPYSNCDLVRGGPWRRPKGGYGEGVCYNKQYHRYDRVNNPNDRANAQMRIKDFKRIGREAANFIQEKEKANKKVNEEKLVDGMKSKEDKKRLEESRKHIAEMKSL